MKNGRRGGRSPHRRDALTLLARARPAALDADHATRSNWPGPDELIGAAGQNGDGAYQSLGSRGERGPGGASDWQWVRYGHGKLAGALASGAVTAAVVGIAVIVGATVFGSRHAPPRLPHPTAGASSSVRPPVAGGTPVGAFHPLALLSGWQGQLAVATGNGVVYLAGQASSRDAHSSPITTLPPGLRPAAEIDVVISLGAAGDGSLKILPNGSIVPVSVHGSFSLVSLAGVSFPIGSG